MMLLEFTNDDDYPSEAVNMLYMPEEESSWLDKTNDVTQI